MFQINKLVEWKENKEVSKKLENKEKIGKKAVWELDIKRK